MEDLLVWLEISYAYTRTYILSLQEAFQCLDTFLGGYSYFFYYANLRYSRQRTFGSAFLLLLKASVLPRPFSILCGVDPSETAGLP